MYCFRLRVFLMLSTALYSTALLAEDGAATLSDMFPGVCSGALSLATLGELPEGVVLRSGSVAVTDEDLTAEIAKSDAETRNQLENNKLHVLENMATPKLLLHPAGAVSPDALGNYFEALTVDVEVSEEEVTAFYEANKDMCGGATLSQVKDQLAQYVLEQKKQDFVAEHVRTIGERSPIVLAADWTKEQAKLALDNPVDKARASGKPSIVDFGSTGCRSCAMMAPILKALEAKYTGKANVLFVHVKEEAVPTARYGIRTIPVQVFFNKEGKEVYRHNGTMTQDEIEKRLVEMGAIL